MQISDSRRTWAGVLVLGFVVIWCGTGGAFAQTVLGLDDDDFAEVPLPFTFSFCGGDYDSVFVGSNGFVTFRAGNADFTPSVPDLLNVPPRIAPLWLDLSPNQGGVVTVENTLAGDFEVVWDSVPEHNTGNSNTFSLTLHPNSTFDFVYGSLDATDGLAGISPGLGAITGDPGEVDLTTAVQPITSVAAGDAVYEVFSGDNDLSGVALDWAACPGGTFILPALPGVCYGSTGGGGSDPGSLLTINTSTGAATVVGYTGFAGVSGLAINSQGEIFGTERATGRLIRIDAASGQGFLVVPTVTVPFLDGIAFDEDDVLYGVAFDAGLTLITIDTSTGLVTGVGSTGVPTAGLAFDPTDGQLYASEGGADGIYQIDKNNGASTFLGPTGFGGSTPDLMFDEAGTLYATKGGGGGSTGGSGSGGPASNSFISVDKSSGAGTLIGATGIGSVSGLACTPAPPAPADADGDGVPDSEDFCAGTVIPEAVPTEMLKTHRWALIDGDGLFDTSPPPGQDGAPTESFTIEDTEGCSCEQIIQILGLGGGFVKFGCNTDSMNTFISLLNP